MKEILDSELSLEIIARRLRDADSIILTTHAGPDGDGLGCMVALARALEAHGKTVLRLLPEPLPECYAFLDPEGRIRAFPGTGAPVDPRDWDLALVLDTHQWGMLARVGEWLKGSGLPTLFLDHHPTDEPGRVEVKSEDSAVATGTIVYHLILEQLGWEITREIAEPLYVSISYDTNSFKYLRNDPVPLEIGADLVRRGVDTTWVYRNLFASNPLRKARILGWVLSSVEFFAEGRLASVRVPHAVVQKYQLRRDDLRDTITHMLEIEGVEVAVMLKELDPRSIKVSFRSKGTYHINEIAAWMGGGGHTLAAGCEYEGDLETGWKRLRGPLEDLLHDRLDLEELRSRTVDLG